MVPTEGGVVMQDAWRTFTYVELTDREARALVAPWWKRMFFTVAQGCAYRRAIRKVKDAFRG